MDPKRDLGYRVKKQRTEMGFRQEELAKSVGISRTYLSQIESSNAINISAAILENLAKVLNVKISYLLGEEDGDLVFEKPLYQYALEENLSLKEILQLDNIALRGKRPASKEDWAKLHNAIKRALEEYSNNELK